MKGKRVDFTMEKAIPLSTKVRRIKGRILRRKREFAAKVRCGISKITPSPDSLSTQISFLAGTTHLLIIYSIWFMWNIISPVTPYEKLTTLTLSLGYYALLQYIILKATEAAEHSKALK